MIITCFLVLVELSRENAWSFHTVSNQTYSQTHRRTQQQTFRQIFRKTHFPGRCRAYSDPDLIQQYFTGCGNLIINYIPPHLVEEELLTLFKAAGPVENVKIVRKKPEGHSLGYAFVKVRHCHHDCHHDSHHDGRKCCGSIAFKYTSENHHYGI